MRCLMTFLLAGALVAAVAEMASAQEGQGVPPRRGEGGGPGGGRPGGPGGPGQGGFHLLPRFLIERLNLTEAQMQQVSELEKETKAKLEKILTDEQKKTLAETRPPRPGQGGPGQGGPGQGGQGRAGGRPGQGPGQGGPGQGGGQGGRPQRPPTE